MAAVILKAEIESNEIFHPCGCESLTSDPTYTLIEALYSILFLFCNTYNHHSVSEPKSG